MRAQGMNSELLSNEDLAEQYINGDEAAFSKIFERLNNFLLFYVRRIVYHPQDAQDVVQNTWIKVSAKLKEGYYKREEGALSTWIIKIAHNLMIDSFRKVKKIKTTAFSDIVYENTEENFMFDTPDTSLNAEEEICMAEKRSQLQQYLSRSKGLMACLNKHEYDIINLRYFKEMKYLDIAKKLNMPEGTVKARLFRAKEKMLKMAR